MWDQLYAQFSSFFLLRLSRKAPQSSKIDPPAPRPLPKKQHSPEHHTPTMEEKIKPDVATKPDITARKGVKPLRREESRSRLPSISQLQEKLRKRWPRSLKMREGSDRERSYPKIWKTAPRVVRKVYNATSFQINVTSFQINVTSFQINATSFQIHSRSM